MSYARSMLCSLAGGLSLVLAAVVVVEAGIDRDRYNDTVIVLVWVYFLLAGQFGALFAWRRIDRGFDRILPTSVAAGIELASAAPLFIVPLAALVWLASFVFPSLLQLLWLFMLWPVEWQPLQVLGWYTAVAVPVCVVACVPVARIRRDESRATGAGR